MGENVKKHFKGRKSSSLSVNNGFINGKTWFGVDNLLLIRMAAAVVLFIIGLVAFSDERLTMIFMLLSFLCSGYDILILAVQKLFREKKLSEELIVSLVSIITFAISVGYEGAAVMLIYRGGFVLRSYADGLSDSTLLSKIDPILPNYRVTRGDEEISVPGDRLKVGDIISLESGSRIPADSTVLEGETYIDLTPLCGRARKEHVVPGSTVYAGTVNSDSAIRVQIAAAPNESVNARTIGAIYGKGCQNSNYSDAVSRYSGFYAPFALGAALLIALLMILFSASGTEASIHRAMVLLIVASPTALLVSIPSTYKSGLFSALKNGVLVKGAAVMDAIAHTGAFVFDKNDLFATDDYHILSMKSDRMDLRVMLKVAAHACCRSEQKVFKAICAAYNGILENSLITEYGEAEEGLYAVIDGIRIDLGSKSHMQQIGIETEEIEGDVLPVFMALNNVYAGCIILRETIADTAATTVMSLESTKGKCIMLSEDSAEKSSAAASAAGVEEFYSECMPMDRLALMQEIKDRYPVNSVLGISKSMSDDAIVSSSDICVTLDGVHSSAALQNGAVVVMDVLPDSLAEAIDASRTTQRIVKQNTIGIVVIKALLLLLALLGVTYQLWFAILIDVVIGIAAILRSTYSFGKTK